MYLILKHSVTYKKNERNVQESMQLTHNTT